MIRPRGTILCAGNLVLDILVRTVDNPRYGATTWVGHIEESLGGNASNTSYALARLGIPVRVMGAVGRDDSGDRVLGKLAEAGVDLSAVARTGAATATGVSLVASTGERCLLLQPGASREALSAPMDPAAFRDGAHLHLANPFGLAAMRPLAAGNLERARQAGLTTSIDAAWDPMDEWMRMLGPSLPHTDLLLLNTEEARMLSGHDRPEAAGAFLQQCGVGVVVVKLGERGCAVFSGAEAIQSPGFAVQVVDTTGAGDCFAAGFLAALHKGASYAAAARFANAVGALSVSRLGSVTGLLSYSDTEAWMERQLSNP